MPPILRERGYEAEIEKPVGGGKTIDLVAAKEDERIAIEIETGKSDVRPNVAKCIEAGCNDVLVFATRRSALSTV